MKMEKLEKQNNKNIPKLRFPEFSGEWEEKSGNEIFQVISNKDHDSKLPILAISQEYGAIPRDMIDYKISVTNKSINSYKVVEKGDFIISLRSFQGGIEYSNYKGICSPAYIILRPFKEINSIYYKHYFKTERYIKLLNRNIEGIRDGKMISYKQFSEITISFPSIQEQQKIANFLTTIDKRIEKLIDKKSLLENYKKGVMQQIFSQKIRFKDDDGGDYPDWEEKRLGEYLVHKSKKNKNKEIKLVLSVSNKKGFISQEEQFDGYEVASKDLSNYKIVKKYEYAYNPSRINVGSIARLQNFDIGIVSPMYVVFSLKGNLSYMFFDNLYKTYKFKYLIKIGCSGSVRDSLNFEDLSNFKINLPSLPEQQKIANFLTFLDKKIENMQTKIEESKIFKKGLLQKMFV